MLSKFPHLRENLDLFSLIIVLYDLWKYVCVYGCWFFLNLEVTVSSYDMLDTLDRLL